jgi:hypothetical protein
VASHRGVVVTIETGDRSFGTFWLTDLVEEGVEPYRGGQLINGVFRGTHAFIWIGSAHSLLLAYDSISADDVREVLDGLEIVEEADGIVAMGLIPLEQTTVYVPFRGGGGLDIEPAAGPANKELVVERGSNGEVTSINVAYPTANALAYIPPNQSGESFLDLVELVDVVWDR